MSKLGWILLGLMTTAAAAPPGGVTVCRRDSDTVLSYAGGVEGFRPGENFIRTFRREAPDAPYEAPRFIETLEFNGDDAAYTYDYELPDGTVPRPATPAEDRVHAMGPIKDYGIKGFLKTYFSRQPKTVFAYVLCNDLVAPGGDCRIDFDDAKRGGADYGTGPALALFLDGGTPRDLCVESVGIGAAEFKSWSLTIDGAAGKDITTACAGPELAKAFTAARTVEASMVKPDGKTVSASLGAPDIAAVIDFAAYLRGLAYQPTAEKAGWLKGLVDASKAAFAAAGETYRKCESSEPPT